jgi:murein DD-endopeptidase MepM/ murein hydrolase activator NlpD
MKQIKFSGVRKFFKGKGFATALVLSITAVGASAYVAYNSAVTRLEEQSSGEQSTSAEAVAPVGNPRDDVPRDTVTANVPVTQAPPPEENSSCSGTDPRCDCELCLAYHANHFVRPESPRIMPINGEIVKPFSNGELVRSNTLGVWRTHDAVDIGAPLGTEVGAMQRGVISEVYTNPMWGVCVVIDHGDGIFSSYMSLDRNVKVALGDEIEAGHIIGLVGNTAEAEIADPPSLHFAVRVNDEWVDPIAYINGNG